MFKKWTTSLTGAAVPAEESVSDGEQFSPHASNHVDEEGEVTDLESSDCEELVDVDQELSAEQTYKETICGVRSFMGWSQIHKFDLASSQDDNPFAWSRTSHTCKVLVKVPIDDWLCRKFGNLPVQEGYPSHTSETAGLNRDQFVKPPNTLKWYDVHWYTLSKEGLLTF